MSSTDARDRTWTETDDVNRRSTNFRLCKMETAEKINVLDKRHSPVQKTNHCVHVYVIHLAKTFANHIPPRNFRRSENQELVEECLLHNSSMTLNRITRVLIIRGKI